MACAQRSRRSIAPGVSIAFASTRSTEPIARAVGAASGGGSAGYVSPERLAGEPASPRDDVYGFGRALEDVLDALGDPGGLGAIVARCLAPAAERPANGDALLDLVAGARKTRA